SDKVACSPPDSIVFTLVNRGCDSLTIKNSTLYGSAMTAISYRTEPALPAILSKPEDTVRVIVYLQADIPTTNDGSLSFSYRMSDGSQFDTIFSIHALVSRGERIATVSQNPIDLGIGPLCVSRDTSILISN